VTSSGDVINQRQPFAVAMVLPRGDERIGLHSATERWKWIAQCYQRVEMNRTVGHFKPTGEQSYIVF
jgi:hypothetical protein